MLSRAVYKKQRGRRLLTALAAVSLLTGTLITAGTALAVHDAGVFELDANALNDGAPGVDWEAIFAEANTPPDGCTGATACSFTTRQTIKRSSPAAAPRTTWTFQVEAQERFGTAQR